MGVSNHYRHVKVHEYETTHRDMLRASTDELIARGKSTSSVSLRKVQKLYGSTIQR